MEKPTVPPEGGRHYKPRITAEDVKAEAVAIVAAHERQEQAAAEQLAQVVQEAEAHLDDHRAASTRDRLAHQSLVEGRN